MRGFFHILKGLFVCVCISAFSMTHVGSVIAADDSECTVKAANENVIVIVCPPGLDQEVWRLAGERACILDNDICNAWIWDDTNKAPQQAPATDSELSKAQVRDAVAIWANDVQRLMILGQVGQ